MSKDKKRAQTQKDHKADQTNTNKGTSGENKAHKAARDNRANQKNSNHKKTN
jgi:hypothetical protein